MKPFLCNFVREYTLFKVYTEKGYIAEGTEGEWVLKVEEFPQINF